MFLSLLFAISAAQAATFSFTDNSCLGGFAITSTGQIICVAVPVPPTPPPDPVANCPGFSHTLNMRITIPPAGSGQGARVYNTDSKALGGAGANFGATDIIVASFVAPATTAANPYFTLGFTHSGGSTGPSSQRTFGVSTVPCDFDGPNAVMKPVEGNVTSIRFSAGTPGVGRVEVVPGTTLYMSVKNYAYGSLYCQSICNAFLSPAF